MKLSERLKRNSDAAIARQPMPAREMEALPAAVPMVVPAAILNMPAYPFGKLKGKPLIAGTDRYRLHFYCEHHKILTAEVRAKLVEIIGYDPQERQGRLQAEARAARKALLREKRDMRKRRKAAEQGKLIPAGKLRRKRKKKDDPAKIAQKMKRDKALHSRMCDGR